LLKVSLKKKITVHIPLILKGEAQGKEEGAVLEQILREVEVEGFPLNIPENIEVDISGLEIGHSLHVENIPSPEGVEIVTEPTATVATLVVKKEEEPEEEELAEEAPSEPEVIKEKKEEAGEGKEGQQAEGKPEKESGKKEGQGEK
jgi:large subunit ribosomal protein L25